MISYSDYLLEKKLEKILEAKISFSKGFSNALKAINTPLANEILNLNSNDIDTQYNYIDTTDENDTVTFTPERKAQQIKQNREELYKVTNDGKYLTGSERNQHIYDRLNHERTTEVYQPNVGTIGKILAETTGTTGKIYVLFECTTEGEIGRRTILNKEALELTDDTLQRVWTTNRNKIKIGRVVRALLNSAEIKSTDSEIEKFVNSFKSTMDIIKDAMNRFNIVEGSELIYWYSSRNYADKNKGTLANSCMASVPKHYLEIYERNPDVCKLVILYDESGKIGDSVYKSELITGRALLWTLRNGDKFLDRIYTTNDSDVDLFKKFAQKNNWWYKKNQNSGDSFTIVKGDISDPNPTLIVTLSNWSNYFPYLDTLMYFNSSTGELSSRQYAVEANYLLQSTSGGFDEIETEPDDY